MTRKQAKFCATLAREFLSFASANRRHGHDPGEHLRLSLGYRAASQHPDLFDLELMGAGPPYRLVLLIPRSLQS